MLKLDNSLLDELGLGNLPEEQKRAMLQHIYETLELRVGTNLANQMSDAQLEEFEKFIDSGGDADQAQALKWLETNLPNYKQVVNEVFEALKAEVKGMAAQIAAASGVALSTGVSAPAAVPGASGTGPASVMPGPAPAPAVPAPDPFGGPMAAAPAMPPMPPAITPEPPAPAPFAPAVPTSSDPFAVPPAPVAPTPASSTFGDPMATPAPSFGQPTSDYSSPAAQPAPVAPTTLQQPANDSSSGFGSPASVPGAGPAPAAPSPDPFAMPMAPAGPTGPGQFGSAAPAPTMYQDNQAAQDSSQSQAAQFPSQQPPAGPGGYPPSHPAQ